MTNYQLKSSQTVDPEQKPLQKGAGNFGLSTRAASMTCYTPLFPLNCLVALFWFLRETTNHEVRFHACQSLALSVLCFAGSCLITALAMIFLDRSVGVMLANFIDFMMWLSFCFVNVICLALTYHHGDTFKVPVIGALCESVL